MAFQITCVFGLYIWCAAADPADPGVFKSKKYLKVLDNGKHVRQKDSKLGGDSTSSIYDANNAAAGGKSLDKDVESAAAKESTAETERPSKHTTCCALALLPCALMCKCCSSSDKSSEKHISEDGMFYCSLCEVEVRTLII